MKFIKIDILTKFEKNAEETSFLKTALGKYNRP